MPKIKTQNSSSECYFSNHGIGQSWPFSIYHKPIEKHILQVAKQVPANGTCLNLGCGFFDLYPILKKRRNWHACDIDKGCISEVNQRYKDIDARVCRTIPEYAANIFDFVISTEVIEHITEPIPWLAAIENMLKPDGIAIISTPNYGFSLLPVIEYSFLEAIARIKGFSRFGLHPNKYSKNKFSKQLNQVFGNDVITITKRSMGMVLVADVKHKIIK